MLLWVLDASLNISMEPFRAFVGDMLPKSQHTAGYAVQTAFIGSGAVVGSIFPWLLDHFGVANVAPDGGIPDTVRFSFWAGAAALFAAVLWTVLTTREYSPEQMARFHSDTAQPDPAGLTRALASRPFTAPIVWLVAGVTVMLAVRVFAFKQEVLLLGALMMTYGLLSAYVIGRARGGAAPGMLGSIIGDFSAMPEVMKRLALVQFLSWAALFIMWIHTTPVVSQYFFGSDDPASAAYQNGANWVGILFAIYNGVAAVAALTLLPWLARRIGKAATHAACLLCGAAGFAGFFVHRDPHWLIASEIGVGIAWASILAMPYAILASSLPAGKLGVYMGLFNVFIVVPQLLVATVMGTIMVSLFPTEPIWTMAFAAGALILAAVATLRVQTEPDPLPTGASQAAA